MNNKYILFASRRLATSSYRSGINIDVLALRCIIFLLMVCASLYCAKANSAQVCIPLGFGVFPSMPTTFNLKYVSGADKLLYEEFATATAAGSCSSQSNAVLEFQLPGTRLFTRNPGIGQIDTGDPSKVKAGYSATTPQFGTLSPSNYVLRLNIYINVTCQGANIAATINGDIFRVTGLSQCTSYSVSYKVEILQNTAAPLTSGYSQAVEDLGIKIKIALLNNNISQAAVTSTIPSSSNLKFTTGLYCSYSLSNSIIAFGTVADYEIFRPIGNKLYTINTVSCQGIIGNNLNIFWRFANPHPTDDSMMLNEVAGGASGVVAQTTCSGRAARHNQSIRAATNIPANDLTISCTASLVQAPEVSDRSDIRAGRFSSSATLVFQFL